MVRRIIIALAATALLSACSSPTPYGAIPSEAQVRWQQMEMNMFCHFGPNTFTGEEWGTGDEPEDIFNPESLDCRQWARTAKAAGMKGIIITGKHHDGFCLWPNPMSSHTVASSPWMDGKGDVLKELSAACREEGLGFGVYISPWDRNDPRYGTPEYNEVFRKTVESALSNYGPVFEQWFDGACGEGPSGKKQVYDWNLFNSEVFELQPDAVIFSDVGPGCRWVGNERGKAGKTSWSRLSTEGFSPGAGAPPTDTLTQGNIYGEKWIAPEADVSIRPGWFYRESEDNAVKSLQDLLDIYYGSVGRNALLLLNVPPDKRGLIHMADSVRLMEFRAALDEIFAEDLAAGAKVRASASRAGRRFSPAKLTDGNYDTYWAAPEGRDTVTIELRLLEKRTFNRILLQEYIPLGQRVASFEAEVFENGSWSPAASETTIGYKRIVLTRDVTTDRIRVKITKSLAPPVLSGFSLYMDNIFKDNTKTDNTI